MENLSGGVGNLDGLAFSPKNMPDRVAYLEGVPAGDLCMAAMMSSTYSMNGRHSKMHPSSHSVEGAVAT